MNVTFLKVVTQTFLALSCAALISPSSFAEPPNLSLLKSELKSYHDSGAYQRELVRIIAQARTYLNQQVRANNQEGQKKQLAIVLDIDETSLSNYNNMIKRDFNGDHTQIHKEVLAANFPASQPTLALYRDALAQGIKVFFVTGRSHSDYNATKRNLLRAGFNHWSGLYMRPDDYHSASIVPFKTQARAAIVKQGYTIVASIGDQCSDLQGGFLQKGFKLPNPFYFLS